MVDLHLHTTASDGRLSPEQLVAAAAAAGLTTIAITDHDTVAATETVARLCRAHGIEATAGIEITAVANGRDVHVLGYFVDPALNHLIEMCRNEELTLRYAADHVKDPSVKALFVERASRRAQFAADLLPYAQRLGGAEAADRTTRGALHRGWMAIKGALIGYSESEMIAEAEQDEDLTLATYEHALDDMLPPTARELVERQWAEIRLAHDRVRAFWSH